MKTEKQTDRQTHRESATHADASTSTIEIVTVKIANTKKLSCRRKTARRFVSLNISLSHSSSFEMTPFS